MLEAASLLACTACSGRKIGGSAENSPVAITQSQRSPRGTPKVSRYGRHTNRTEDGLQKPRGLESCKGLTLAKANYGTTYCFPPPLIWFFNLFRRSFREIASRYRWTKCNLAIKPMLLVEAHSIVVEPRGAGERVREHPEQLRALVFFPALISNLADTVAARLELLLWRRAQVTGFQEH